MVITEFISYIERFYFYTSELLYYSRLELKQRDINVFLNIRKTGIEERNLFQTPQIPRYNIITSLFDRPARIFTLQLYLLPI